MNVFHRASRHLSTPGEPRVGSRLMTSWIYLLGIHLAIDTLIDTELDAD